MRRYLTLRYLALVILMIYLGIRKELSPSWWSEIALFNSVAVISSLSILATPKFHDSFARYFISSAIGIWSMSSILSSLGSFTAVNPPEWISDAGYVVFYPLMIIGLSRALHVTHSSSRLEFVDSIIIALGLTSVISIIFIKPASLTFTGSLGELFLTLFYPIGDLILLGLVISLSLVQKKSRHNFLLTLGLISFAATDMYFLWESANNDYQFGRLTDSGWLLGFILITESFWYQGEEARENLRFNPFIATLALLISASILVISALRPHLLPSIALLPALATILLAFIRMAIAINDAKAVSAERILARTDELTGLANRRKFIAELEKFRTRDSSVLLLDLNGFKSVNDRFGHDVGDDLLKRVALRFTRPMPTNGVLARLGGDEFGVLVAGDGFELAQALRATLTYPFEIEGEPISLDVSIGEAANDGSDQVLRRADEAMYNAKRAGGGVVRWR